MTDPKTPDEIVKAALDRIAQDRGETEIHIQHIDPIVLTADEITLAANGITFFRMMTREEFEAEFGMAGR